MRTPTLVVPEALAKNVRPRRSIPGSAAAPTEAAVSRALKRARNLYAVKTVFGGDTTHAKIYAAGLAARTEPALADTRKRAHAFLMDPSVAAARGTTVDALAAADVMLRRVDRDATLLDVVAVARGLPDALRVALRSTEFGLAAIGGFTSAVYVVTLAEPARLWGEPWRPLRDALCAAPQAEYDAAREVARALRERLGLSSRTALAYAFPDEPWADEDLLAHAKSDAPSEGGVLLSAATSAEAVLGFLTACGDRLDLAPYALDLAHAVPEEVLLPIFSAELARLLVKPKYGPLLKTPPRMIAEAIGCWRTEAAAAVLAPYANHPVLAPVVLGFFRDAPALGAALSKQGTARLAPSIDRVLGRAASEKHAPAATASEVPALLRERPWRAAAGTDSSAREVLGLAMRVEHEGVALTRPVREFEVEARGCVFRDMTRAELATWKKELAAGQYVNADYQHHREKGANAPWEYLRVPDEDAIRAWNETACGLAQSPLQWVAKHGVRVIPGFLTRDWLRWLAWEGHEEYPDAVTSLVSPRVAPSLARAAGRKRARRAALAWLEAHAGLAAVGLVPDALGKEGEARRDAESALLHLAATGHRADVEKAAKGYGAQASAGGATNETVIGSGLMFELPVLVYFLARFRLVTARAMLKYWRHATVGILVASAFLTPGDVIVTTIF
ncbi:MAG: twin-arginine translocase subunit TatC, partial [Deltaproteobacteria bacterium]